MPPNTRTTRKPPSWSMQRRTSTPRTARVKRRWAYAGDHGDAPLVAYLAGKGAKLTDVHILPKPASNPPLTPAQSWALAVGAIYVQRNGTNPHVLGYDADTDDPENAKDELKRDWNVTNQVQLLRCLIGSRIQVTGRSPKTCAQFALMVSPALRKCCTRRTPIPSATIP